MAKTRPAGTLVAKIGSSTLVDSCGAPDRAFIERLCDQVAELMEAGWQVVVVSSGAAAAGMERLGLGARPQDLPTLQACCAAGQAALTETYAELLAKRGYAAGQVLMTRRDVVDRECYLNTRNTFQRLLELGVVPIVNENDTVSVSELAFSDNDMLGAIVSTLIGADLYVILSDVEGLFTANPATHPEASLIPRVEAITPEIMGMAKGAGSAFGTGGMASKLRAARAMLAAGIPMTICQGRGDKALVRAASGEAIGTRFEAAPGAGLHESARKLWIGLAGVPQGTLTVDEGAVRALLEQGSSLLPVGVLSCEGTFAPGDVVDIKAEDGHLVARGLARYSADEVSRIHGLRLDVIERFLPEREGAPLVHRDEMLVF